MLAAGQRDGAVIIIAAAILIIFALLAVFIWVKKPRPEPPPQPVTPVRSQWRAPSTPLVSKYDFAGAPSTCLPKGA